ncbi:hypothetical protein O1L55_25020 [Streptomyces albulus]|nr:hypothetical protein [Streptomyces noursei]
MLVLAVLTVPAWSLRPGHLDEGADPPSSTGRRAHDLLAAAFGPGANGPLTLVIDRTAVPEADRPALADQARRVLGRIPAPPRSPRCGRPRTARCSPPPPNR